MAIIKQSYAVAVFTPARGFDKQCSFVGYQRVYLGGHTKPALVPHPPCPDRWLAPAQDKRRQRAGRGRGRITPYLGAVAFRGQRGMRLLQVILRGRALKPACTHETSRW